MSTRKPDQMRPLAITPHYLAHPAGSCLIEFGDTKVICTASVEEKVPRWLMGKGSGWVTAEYDMLPGSTNSRKPRDARKGKLNGRTQEISRLIGRALRSVIDLKVLGEQSITVDCDVLQADGGTRTASITGGYVALALAIQRLMKDGLVKKNPLNDHVVAVSAGFMEGQAYLDLDYYLDVRADVDMNVVMTGEGRLGEVQGTGEEATFSRDELNTLLDLCFGGLPDLVTLQKKALDYEHTSEPGRNAPRITLDA